MSPFLRIGFSNFEIDPGLAYLEEVLNPYCAVYMKEAIDTGQFKNYIKQGEKNLKIFTFEKLEPGDVWRFYLATKFLSID